MKKLVALILIVALLVSGMVIFAGCEPKDTGNKKAMLLLHGIGEGVLYNKNTNEPIYCITDFSASDIDGLLGGITSKDPDKALLDILTVNEDGTLREDDVVRPANMDDPKGQYVMANLMQPLYNMLSEAYSDTYDVIVWQYDWRKNTDDIAADLEAYINQKGYEKVMLFTHSMGGMVASSFFEKKTNRDKTELFVPFSTPFYGATDTIYMLYEGLIASIPEMIDQFYVDIPEEFNFLINALGIKSSDCNEQGQPNPSVMFNKLMSMANNPIIKSVIDINSILGLLKDVVKNLESLYRLFPSEAYFDNPLYEEDVTFFSYDSAYKSFSELLAILQADEYLSEIIKMSDGELRPAFTDLIRYQQAKMPNGEHISNLVNTFYVQGNGVKTLKTVYATSEGEATYDYFNYGDGLVSVWSGTAGLLRGDETQAQLDALSDKVYVSNGGDGRVGTSHLFIIFADDVLEAVGNKVDATLAAIK